MHICIVSLLCFSHFVDAIAKNAFTVNQVTGKYKKPAHRQVIRLCDFALHPLAPFTNINTFQRHSTPCYCPCPHKRKCTQVPNANRGCDGWQSYPTSLLKWRHMSLMASENIGNSILRWIACSPNNKETSKRRITGPLLKVSSCVWIPLKGGQLYGKGFHVMTSHARPP